MASECRAEAATPRSCGRTIQRATLCEAANNGSLLAQLGNTARDDALKQGDHDAVRALKEFECASMVTPPAVVEPMCAEVQVCVQQGVRKECPEAQASFREAIRIDPKAHNNLGVLLQHERKNYAEAEKHFRQAIRIDPKNAVTHSNLGSLLETTNKNGTAEEQPRADSRVATAGQEGAGGPRGRLLLAEEDNKAPTKPSKSSQESCAAPEAGGQGRRRQAPGRARRQGHGQGEGAARSRREEAGRPPRGRRAGAGARLERQAGAARASDPRSAAAAEARGGDRRRPLDAPAARQCAAR